MDKVSYSIGKEFDSNLVYNKKHLGAKMKWYNGKINTNSHSNKIPKEDFQFICLLVILIDFILSTRKNYYHQIFLEECKYIIKEKKIYNYIIDNVEITDVGNSDEEILEKTQIKKFWWRRFWWRRF